MPRLALYILSLVLCMAADRASSAVPAASLNDINTNTVHSSLSSIQYQIEKLFKSFQKSSYIRRRFLSTTEELDTDAAVASEVVGNVPRASLTAEGAEPLKTTLEEVPIVDEESSDLAKQTIDSFIEHTMNSIDAAAKTETIEDATHSSPATQMSDSVTTKEQQEDIDEEAAVAIISPVAVADADVSAESMVSSPASIESAVAAEETAPETADAIETVASESTTLDYTLSLDNGPTTVISKGSTASKSLDPASDVVVATSNVSTADEPVTPAAPAEPAAPPTESKPLNPVSAPNSANNDEQQPSPPTSSSDAGSSGSNGEASSPVGSEQGDSTAVGGTASRGDEPQSIYDILGPGDNSTASSSSGIDVTMIGLLATILLVMLLICCLFCRSGRASSAAAAHTAVGPGIQSKYSKLPTDENIELSSNSSGIELSTVEEGNTGGNWEEWDSQDEDKDATQGNNHAARQSFTTTTAGTGAGNSSRETPHDTSVADSLPRSMSSSSHHSNRSGSLSGRSSKTTSPSTLPPPPAITTATTTGGIKPASAAATVGGSVLSLGLPSAKTAATNGSSTSNRSRRGTSSQQQNDVDLFASIGISAAPKFKEPVKATAARSPVGTPGSTGGSSRVSYKADDAAAIGSNSSKWNEDEELELSD